MKKRGMALVLVLTVASVVVMLTGAFVANNHAQFTTLSATQRQREALMATESGVNYVYFRMEQDETWAKDVFPTTTDISPANAGLRVRQIAGSHRVEGWVLDENQTGREPYFQITIHNNLSSNTERANPRVPTDAVLLQVVGRSGGFEARTDVMFRGEPLYDSSVTANRFIQLGRNNVAANRSEVHISSADPARNWVRSNGDILLSNFAQTNSPNTVVVDNPSGVKGVVWAKGDVRSGDDNLQGALLDEAIRKSGGIIAPRSRQNHDIYKLRISDLNLGDPGTARASLPAGAYYTAPGSITDGENSYFAKSLTHFDSVNQVVTNYYDGRLIPPGLTTPPDVAYPNGWTVINRRCDGEADLGSAPEGGPAMKFDFDDNVFRTTTAAQIDVNGDLSFISSLDDAECELKLESINGNVGVIKSTGSIQVQGPVSGSGALLANRDLLIEGNAQTFENDGSGANVDANQSTGVVLFGDNVTIYGGNTGRMAFKGLIYAEHDFNVQGAAQVVTVNNMPQFQWTGSETLEKLVLEGAVVARQGHVNIVDTEYISLRYNPDYLKALTKGMPDNQRRIQHLWSRSY